MQRIVIFHYHLNPGGVTRIIESQIASLKRTMPGVEIKVLCGDGSNTGLLQQSEASFAIYPELNYLTDLSDLPGHLARIRKIFEQELRPDDVLHAHNLNLGKNPLLTMVVAEYIEKGQIVINHAHDFSEDRRENQEFLEEIIEKEFGLKMGYLMYPDNENLAFIVLNSNDYWRLITYGVDKNRIVLLPNPVSFDSQVLRNDKNRTSVIYQLQLNPDKLIVTYPVRVIRRKNIAEFILLAVLLNEQANWLVTQPPKNPVEIVDYDKWKNFCSSHQIEVVFEAGVIADFMQLMAATDFCISTSLQEGFGMAFMEPWLMDIPVVGRDIPMVTKDIINKGVEFTILYDDIKVEHKSTLVSFAKLSIDEQQDQIKVLLEDKKNHQKVLELNPFIANLLNPVQISLIDSNKEVIRTHFSLENYGKTLHGLYQKLTTKSSEA